MTFYLGWECRPFAAEFELLELTKFHWRQMDGTNIHYIDVIQQELLSLLNRISQIWQLLA